MDSTAVKNYLLDLQNRIVSALEAVDGGSFARDEWTRDEGGGGISRIMEDGVVFARDGQKLTANRRRQSPRYRRARVGGRGGLAGTSPA